ncbi:unnamed protein product [Clonostachys solani]|uniref:Uncharacterized protein n=1 Tax=Clonostachys solani TaxID=160281 RepID=A0A9N9VXM6_9HYPO|nr:unnamed protein product [Clonostachys solani]
MQIHDAHSPTEPLDFLQAWVKVHHLDTPAPGQPTPAAAALLSAVPRSPAVRDEAIQALLGAGVCISLTDGGACKATAVDETARCNRRPPASSSAQRRITFRGDRVFKFEPPGAQLQPFNFASSHRDGMAAGLLKRVRHGLDVDGPNTADLGCKKRRLRTELITSRLSHAYSQPATHILNREGQKSGDKRFLKMATSSVAPVARRLAHLRATSYIRYSTMNRLRQRLGIPWPMMIPVTVPDHGQPQAGSGKQKDAEKDTKEAPTSLFELKSKTQWRPPSLLTASRGQFVPLEVKAANHKPALASSAATSSRTSSASSSQAPASMPSRSPSPLSSRLPLALPPRPPSALQNRPTSQLDSSPSRNNKALSLSPKPASSPAHAADAGAAKGKSSGPALPVSSPERPPRSSFYDNLEEDSFASRHLIDDDFNDAVDDPDEVYSDFSVIFSTKKKKKGKRKKEDGCRSGEGENGGEGSGSDDEDGSYEEFLDELDGISWVAF